MSLLQWLLHLLFPPKCLLCQTLLDRELDLCAQCRVHGPEYPDAKIRIPHLDSWLGMWYYENDARNSLLRYKFGGRQSYARGYGRLLAMRLLREREGQFDLIAWVPISRRRKIRRGFDQVELLANAVAGELGVEAVKCLHKRRHTKPQSRLSSAAERRANVLGVFEEVMPERFRGKRILLLDDILTTGATLSEAGRVLMTAGAAEVHAAVVAVSKFDK